MRYFPAFLDLQRRRVLVAGGGVAALNKVRLMAATDADIHVAASHLAPELAAMAAQGRISVLNTPVEDIDLAGYAAIFAATDSNEDELLAARARAANIPVNVVDKTELCSFITPSIVDRGKVVVAIGTEGAAPVLARRLRARIETLLPSRLGVLAEIMGRFRPRLVQRLRTVPERRRFWEGMLDGPIGAAFLAGKVEEAESALGAAIDAAEGDRKGIVFLVGAGPGDPELLTLKALRVLQDADIIFYDDLVTPEVLDLARRDAERVFVGKRAGEPGISQDEINLQIAEAALQGLRVVRLKGGDPFIFGRGGEEIGALREHGIDTVVVPGITAALGCTAEVELPLSHRAFANRVTFMTAHRADEAKSLNFKGLDDPETTVVVYMGRSAAAVVARELIAAGRDPSTPVAVLARGTRADAVAVTGRLNHLAVLAERAGKGPALIVIGEVVTCSTTWRADVEALAAAKLAG